MINYIGYVAGYLLAATVCKWMGTSTETITLVFAAIALARIECILDELKKEA